MRPIPKLAAQRNGLLTLALSSLAITAAVACDKLALDERVSLPEGDGDGMGGRPTDPDRDAAVDEGFKPTPKPDDGGVGEGDGPSCGERPATDLAFSKQALLKSIAQCTARELCEFEALAKKFSERGADYAADPSETKLEAVRDAWYFAQQSWQVLELFHFGPAAVSMEPGGRDLRNHVYVFPFQSRCKTDEALSDASYTSALDKVVYTGKGLGASEYLLFYTGSDNGCSSFNRLNTKGEWAKMSADELLGRKRAMLASVAAEIHKTAGQLLSSWASEGENFAETLSSAGHGSALFASEQAGLNAVSNALFYMDKEVKDWKVSRPAGLTMECTAGCDAQAESLYARTGSENIRQNLKGFRLLFQGCGENFGGLGFDDWLHAVNMGSVADQILAGLDAADAAFADFDIDHALQTDPSQINAKRLALKGITDLLKTDFLTALNLTVPMSAEGDND